MSFLSLGISLVETLRIFFRLDEALRLDDTFGFFGVTWISSVLLAFQLLIDLSTLTVPYETFRSRASLLS
jgi:hypothetical protein